MFSLTGATRYKYVPNYQDMRGGYDKLCSVLRSLGENPEDGTAYVFTSRDQKLVKIIRHDHSESQLYVQRFDYKILRSVSCICIGMEISCGNALLSRCQEFAC